MKTKKLAFVEEILTDQWDYSFCNYIKKRSWWSCHCASVARGLQEMGYEVKGFLKEELPSLPLTKETVVRGSIRTTRTAFNLLGVKQPVNVDIPKCLRRFAYRKIWESTLGEVRRARRKVHIKPLEIQKGFSGHIWSRGDQYTTKNFPASYKLLVSEVVNLTNEFRSYVLNGKIVGSEAERKEETEFLKKLIRNYCNAPAAYAIDCAWIVPENWDDYEDKPYYKVGQLAIVELNEGFSAGTTGGISDRDYAKLTEARWKEIVNQ